MSIGKLTNIREMDLRNFTSFLRIGERGEIVITRNGKVVGAADEEALNKDLSYFGFPINLPETRTKFYPVVKGEPSICLYDDFGEFRIFGYMPSEEMYTNRNSIAIGLISFHLVLFAIAYIIMVLLVRRVIIKGIYQVNRSLEKITKGDLNELVNVRTNKEMVLLSEGVNTMLKSLRRANAEKEAQINRELDLGRTIQKSTLPNTFPAFPDLREFDLYATMEAAKEVGGDFYDFFLIDQSHLCIVIGDVSGKGIPAALFMMRTKVMIENLAQSGISVTEICNKGNNQLHENNVTGMFVTVFLAVLDIKTGKLICVNAGHNLPLLIKREGQANWVNAEGGLMLAAIDNFKYQRSEFQMEPGDTLYVYTDGVTEAFSDKDEMFGNERLQSLLASKSAASLSPEDLLKFVRSEVVSFVGNAKQSDDITMLAMRYNGPSETHPGHPWNVRRKEHAGI